MRVELPGIIYTVSLMLICILSLVEKGLVAGCSNISEVRSKMQACQRRFTTDEGQRGCLIRRCGTDNLELIRSITGGAGKRSGDLRNVLETPAKRNFYEIPHARTWQDIPQDPFETLLDDNYGNKIATDLQDIPSASKEKLFYALIPVEKDPAAPVNPIFKYRQGQYRADGDDWTLKTTY